MPDASSILSVLTCLYRTDKGPPNTLRDVQVNASACHQVQRVTRVHVRLSQPSLEPRRAYIVEVLYYHVPYHITAQLARFAA